MLATDYILNTEYKNTKSGLIIVFYVNLFVRKINVFVANFFSLASLSSHIITCIGVAAPLSSIMSNNPPILF